MNRYSSRLHALEELDQLRSDIEWTHRYDSDYDSGVFVVENPVVAYQNKSTASILLTEGKNLLEGKPEDMQKLGGALLRVHFTNQELTEAAGR